ncbi:MAG: MmgE/PrpD family protein [Burkholderiaceae bacterium]
MSTIAERLADVLARCAPQADPLARPVAERLVLDITGLCMAARHEPYVRAAIASIDQPGPCSVIGHAATMGVEGAAFVNGTAAHGEDFDDTYGAARSTPARSSCRRCSPRPSATTSVASTCCAASRPAPR